MKTAEAGLTTQELANEVNETVSTISFWAQKGLLSFQRQNGRTRLFPRHENVLRIRYVRRRQRSPVKLDELRKEMERGRHRVRPSVGE